MRPAPLCGGGDRPEFTVRNSTFYKNVAHKGHSVSVQNVSSDVA